jgi:hypothetical protein
MGIFQSQVQIALPPNSIQIKYNKYFHYNESYSVVTKEITYPSSEMCIKAVEDYLSNPKDYISRTFNEEQTMIRDIIKFFQTANNTNDNIDSNTNISITSKNKEYEEQEIEEAIH